MVGFSYTRLLVAGQGSLAYALWSHGLQSSPYASSKGEETGFLLKYTEVLVMLISLSSFPHPITNRSLTYIPLHSAIIFASFSRILRPALESSTFIL
uniref:Uncharacterized protein n=1 Tax=Bionectria ochroleuca TaxID=29856 RepID=A0A8H7KF20_BIOOC